MSDQRRKSSSIGSPEDIRARKLPKTVRTDAESSQRGSTSTSGPSTSTSGAGQIPFDNIEPGLSGQDSDVFESDSEQDREEGNSVASLPESIKTFYEPYFQGTALTQLQGDDLDAAYEAGSEPFLFISELGSGKYGSVYRVVRAEHRNDPNVPNVAIKIIRPENDENRVWVYEKEFSIVAKLMDNPHTNIVVFYEVFHNQLGDYHYFVLELAPLGDLFSVISQQNSAGNLVWLPLQPQYCRHFIKGIAEGVRHLFNIGISHGDVKLENILVFEKPSDNYLINKFMQMVPKLTDFSNSEMAQPGERIVCRGPRCSPYSAAPETYYPTEPEYDMKMSDVYSIGALMLTMLLGCYPFQAPDYTQTAEIRIQSCMILKSNRNFINQLIRSLNYNLKQLLLKVLEPIPDRRITIDQFLSDCWFTQRLEAREMEEPWSNNLWKGLPQSGWTGRRPSV